MNFFIKDKNTNLIKLVENIVFMKKFLCLCLCVALCFCFCGCEISDTELANSLEGNMTRLVYSVGYLDAINEEELNALVNGGSTYFTHSSLYSGGANTSVTSLGDTNNSLVPNSGAYNSTQTNNGRMRVYTSGLTSNLGSSTQNISNTSEEGTTTYVSGLVSLDLIENSSQELNDILLEISQKRGIIMLYCTDLRSGKATLSLEAKEAISEYTNIIKETTAYLNSNAGDLTNHFNAISSIALNENSLELVNARLIRANEVLKTRYAKLDTCLDSMSAIIDILHSSTSFNYVDLYNAGINSYYNDINKTETPSAEENSSSLANGPISTIESSINNNEPTNITNNGATTNDNFISTNPNQTNNNCCNNSLGYNLNNNPSLLNNTENNGVNNLKPNNAIPPNGGTQTRQDNTIINYNLSGENSSNMNVNNDTNLEDKTSAPLPSTNNYSEALNESNINSEAVVSDTTNASNQNQTLNNTTPTTINNEIGLNTPSLPLDNASSLATSEETILNGGLVKKANSYSVALNTLPDIENTTEGDAIRLNVIEPENKTNKQDSVSHPHIDLREDEITESEKELTPDLLPLIGENEIKEDISDNVYPLPFKPVPELGIIALNPITYEDENPIMLLPRK